MNPCLGRWRPHPGRESYTVEVVDPGDALFAGADLRLPAASDFLACTYWASMGFAIPASIGAWGGSSISRVKPLVLTGDGSLLMSANELATWPVITFLPWWWCWITGAMAPSGPCSMAPP
jgi:TPP-dependent 2-oxoacid decarboxylase